MGRKPYCPDGGKDKSKKKKKKDTDMDQTKRNTTDQKNKPTTSPGGGSAHKDQSDREFYCGCYGSLYRRNKES